MPIANFGRAVVPCLLAVAASLILTLALAVPASAGSSSRPAAKTAAAKTAAAKAAACKKARRRHGARSARARRACRIARLAARRKPKSTRPAPTEPVTTEPVTTEPVTTEPAPTEPVSTEPILTQPAPTEPVVSDPVVTEPAPTEPAITQPAPAPVPETGPIPSTARLHWNGDFSTNSWLQWDSGDDDCRPQDHTTVTSPVPPGHAYASRHTVTVDSTLNQSGTRCLVYNDPKTDPTRGKSHGYAGAEAWYEDWMYFPADFDPAPNTDWNWVWQLHNWPDSAGPVNLVAGVITNSSDGGASGGKRLSLRVIGGGSPTNPIDGYGTGNYRQNPDVREKWLRGPEIQRGRWYRMVVRVKWSRHSTGVVEYWLDNQLVGSYTGPNLFYHASGGGYAMPDHAGQTYYSVGYYRPRTSLPAETVYHAGTRVHKP